jgi:hypothetical protein
MASRTSFGTGHGVTELLVAGVQPGIGSSDLAGIRGSARVSSRTAS